ncbi:hypothetical protein HIM_09882 [Hirsutella minnesotensis 3608]|uniref:DUF1772 domain-containing protein n=1 Tax=Hirsutella minnesotensis 3608 TaxID=1043627 RepID=A0A0F8A2V7_9HYPO|nr:hypothetical protein HIM_09882 [Hirsutella minnesotensis 3608]
MASGLFSPHQHPKMATALLLAPLVSSTGSLLFAWDQHLFLSTLIKPELADGGHSEAVLGPYWRALFPAGLSQVVGLLSVTTWTSVGAIAACRGLLQRRGAASWYAAAVALAVGHLLYVPLVARRIEFMSAEESSEHGRRGKTRVQVQREWLTVNLVRMLTTDLGAWACCLVAVSKALGLGSLP